MSLYRFVSSGAQEITLNEKPNISAAEAIKLAQSRKTVPAPTEMDQVARNGTKTSDFKTDISLLKSKLKAFYALEKDYDYHPHFYFGKLNKKEWVKMAEYHLSHHLKQFGV